MSRELRSVVAALAALVVLAVVPAHAAAAGNVAATFVAGDLVIESEVGGGSATDIIRVNPLTGAQTPLVTGPGFQGEGTYAFGQTLIAFTAQTGGTYQIFTGGPNGESPTQRTFGSEDHLTAALNALDPGLPPVHELYYATGNDIYAQKFDGTGILNLTPGTPNSFESIPVISPRGDLAAFQSFNQNTFDVDIGVVNLDGTGFRLVTAGNSMNEFQPAFDHTGRMLYFAMQGASGDDIYRINVDGTGLTPVVALPNHQFLPHLDPTGMRIAFTSDHLGDVNGDGAVNTSDYEIWTRDLGAPLRGGGGDVRLTNNTVPDFLSDWGALPDEKAPKLKLSGEKKQELGKQVTVKAKCDEACTATAKGTLVVPGSKGSDKLLKATKFKLKKKAKDLVAGKAKALKLKIPGNAGKAAADALDAGDKVKAKLKVSAADGSGNKDTAKRTITLTD